MQVGCVRFEGEICTWRNFSAPDLAAGSAAWCRSLGNQKSDFTNKNCEFAGKKMWDVTQQFSSAKGFFEHTQTLQRLSPSLFPVLIRPCPERTIGSTNPAPGPTPIWDWVYTKCHHQFILKQVETRKRVSECRELSGDEFWELASACIRLHPLQLTSIYHQHVLSTGWTPRKPVLFFWTVKHTPKKCNCPLSSDL